MGRYLAAVLFALAVPVTAQVTLVTRADGTRFVTNEAPSWGIPRSAAALLPPVSDLDALIERHASGQRLEPRLVRAVVQVESGYDPAALSHRGAMGLMQLMPETARLLAVVDPYEPDANLRGGTAYLRQLLDRFDGRLELALAGYNAGPEAVTRYGGVPPYPETRTYVERVLRLFDGESEEGSLDPPPGRRTYLVQGPNDRLLVTTTPPRQR